MITAFTTKFKDIIGQTHMPVTRKRQLEDDDDDDILGVGEGEPAHKRSRPLAETEEPLSRSYTRGGHTILKGTSKRLSNIWSWMSSFITPSLPYDDRTNTEMSSRELHYLGALHQKDAPTKRPAISRRTIDMSQVKRDYPKLAAIDSKFRFSPSVTSTAAKAGRISASKSLLSDRYLSKNSAQTRVTLLSHHKKSSGLSQTPVKTPVKRLYETKYPYKNSKSIFNMCSNLTGKGKFCTKETFRHEDKMLYKRLLQQYADDPSGSPFSMSKVPSLTSLSSNSSSMSPGIISRTPLDPRWTKDKAQQIEAKSPIISPKAEGFFSFKRDNAKPSIWKEKDVSRVSAGVPLTNGKISDQSVKDVEDDCCIIAEEIKVPSRRNSLERTLLESPVYDEQWTKDLNERFNRRAKLKSENVQKATEYQRMCEEVRRKAYTSLDDRIAQRIKQLHLSYPSKIEEIIEEEEEEEEELTELTPPMNALIDDALSSRAPGQVLVDKFNIQITRRDIHTLAGLNWLNDEVINFYMNLLMERGKNDNHLNVHAFNTFFYPKLVNNGYSSVRRWTKKVDVFKHDLLLVPVHLGMHWCLATINFRSKQIQYYDSMLGDNDRCLEALLKYLESEHQDKKQSNYDTGSWTIANVKKIPQQMNGSDCGMFACKFSEYLSRGAKISFDQQHMPYFRRRMIFEIVSGKLL